MLANLFDRLAGQEQGRVKQGPSRNRGTLAAEHPGEGVQEVGVGRLHSQCTHGEALGVLELCAIERQLVRDGVKELGVFRGGFQGRLKVAPRGRGIALVQGAEAEELVVLRRTPARFASHGRGANEEGARDRSDEHL